MNFLEKNAGAVALIAVLIAVGGYFFPQAQSVFGASGTRFPNGISADSTSPSAGQVRGTTLTVTGAATLTGGATISSSGSTITGANFGTCAILAYATTIAATSTATVDCSSTGRVGGTLTGITSGDNVMAMATTSISSTFLGVKIVGAHASTTAGYLTLDLVNETGTTFTWSGTASSTIQYQVLR